MNNGSENKVGIGVVINGEIENKQQFLNNTQQFSNQLTDIFQKNKERITNQVIEPLTAVNQPKVVTQIQSAFIRDFQKEIGTIANSNEYKNFQDKLKLFQTVDKSDPKTYNRVYSEVKQSFKTVQGMIGDAQREMSFWAENQSSQTGEAKTFIEATIRPQKRQLKRIADDMVKDMKDEVEAAAKQQAQEAGAAGESGGIRGMAMPAYLASTLYSLTGAARQFLMYQYGEKTAFDINSAEGNYASRMGYATEGVRQRAQFAGKLTGTGIGALGTIGGLVAAPFTGGVSVLASLLMPYLGGQVGGELGSIFAEGKAKELEKETKKNLELTQFVKESMATFSGYDIARKRFGARFGNEGVGGEGLGYSPEQRYQLAYSYGAMGVYGKSEFQNALGYSRYTGTSPESTLQLNQLSRLTGKAYGGIGDVDYFRTRLGADQRTDRLIEVTVQLSQMMAQRIGVKDENQMRENTGGMIELIRQIGGKTPLGDVTLRGMETFTGMQGLMTGTNPASNFLTMQSLGLGKIPLWDVWKKQKEGIWNKDNFRDIVSGYKKLQKTQGLPDEAMPWMLAQNTDLGQLPLDVIEEISGVVTGKTSIDQAYATANKFKPKTSADFKKLGAGQVSGTEEYQERLKTIQTSIDEELVKGIRTQETLAAQTKMFYVNSNKGFTQMLGIYFQLNQMLNEMFSSVPSQNISTLQQMGWQPPAIAKYLDPAQGAAYTAFDAWATKFLRNNFGSHKDSNTVQLGK